MFSTKFWFTLVTLAMGAAVSLVLLARDAHNLARADDVRSLLRKDRGEVWALLKAESRVRLDELLRVAADNKVLNHLDKASNRPEKVTSEDRNALTTVLKVKNKSLDAFEADMLVAVDRRGKSIAHVWDGGPDKIGYHLGGFSAVSSALRGFMQDRRTARLLGARPTASGRRQSFRHPAIVRMSNTNLLPGEDDAE